MNMTHEELFVKILDQMPFGVYCVDTDRKIFYWSKGAERISGYKAEDMLGKHCFASHLDHHLYLYLIKVLDSAQRLSILKEGLRVNEDRDSVALFAPQPDGFFTG